LKLCSRSLAVFIIFSLALSACTLKPYSERPIRPIWLQQNVHESWQLSHRNFIGFPVPTAFSVCHDLSCRSVTDTSVYLRMLENQALLRWHRTGPRTSRGIFIGRAPHNTATIVELDTGNRYAVDAWYFDNGELPAIVPLQSWKQGWQPESAEN
jgi:hypothetical protein